MLLSMEDMGFQYRWWMESSVECYEITVELSWLAWILMLSHVFQVSAQGTHRRLRLTEFFTCLQHKRLMLDTHIQLYLHNIIIPSVSHLPIVKSGTLEVLSPVIFQFFLNATLFLHFDLVFWYFVLNSE